MCNVYENYKIKEPHVELINNLLPTSVNIEAYLKDIFSSSDVLNKSTSIKVKNKPVKLLFNKIKDNMATILCKS